MKAWISGKGVESDAPTYTKGLIREVPASSPMSRSTWGVFLSLQHSGGINGNREPSVKRFRLAGTFAIESDNGNRLQKAILDDMVTREQKIVGVGDVLDDISVVDIRYDRIVIRSPSGTRELVLEFSSHPDVVPVESVTNQLSTSSAISNRFGCVMVQEGRWKFSRQPMVDYYQELLDEPDRMVALFDTMKPVRDERNRITGYIVGIEGEKPFFEAVGLREGDIVRSVNSVAMTNRKRAEFFIDEFLKNRMTAIVIDVERDGKVQKQVYQVRE